MAENTKIEWADHTLNPWRGCTAVSPACENCYAETMSKRNHEILGTWGKYGTRVIASESMWKQPLKWNRDAEREGVRKRVFCASLADVFEGNNTLPDYTYHKILEARQRLGRLIADTPHLDWLLLTKRPELVNKIAADMWKTWPANLWIGTTVENQKYADIRIPELLKIPARVRFLSVEPMLGPIDLSEWLWTLKGGKGKPCGMLHLVIVGGESGSKARPMNVEWVRSIRDQCQAAGVPFFFKQGSQANWPKFKDFDSFPSDLQIRETPEVLR